MQYCNGLWQLIQNSVDSQVNDFMDQTYQKLNKKLDSLTKQIQTAHSTTRKKPHTNNSRVISLSNVKFTGEQISTLALGPNYAIEKDPRQYLNELIIDTENAIRQLDSKMYSTFRYLATKKIKQIMTTTTHNILHKRYQYNIKQIRNILRQNNLTVTKADKSKALVIIDINTLNQEVDDFIKENHIIRLSKDPMDTYQKQIQRAIQKCNTLIDKHKQKYSKVVKNLKPVQYTLTHTTFFVLTKYSKVVENLKPVQYTLTQNVFRPDKMHSSSQKP
jgi:archaellum component FlaC